MPINKETKLNYKDYIYELVEYYIKVFGMTRPGIEHRSPELLSNTLPILYKHSKLRKDYKY